VPGGVPSPCVQRLVYSGSADLLWVSSPLWRRRRYSCRYRHRHRAGQRRRIAGAGPHHRGPLGLRLLLADQRKSRCQGCLGEEFIGPVLPDDDVGGHPGSQLDRAAAGVTARRRPGRFCAGPSSSV